MVRLHHALSVLFAIGAVGLSAAGCSEDEKATPRVTFYSEVTGGGHTKQECPETGKWFEIGSFGNPATGEKVAPVDDGGDFGQGRVSASCSVKPSGDGFEVKATATLSGATGGSVTIEGFMRTTGDKQENIAFTLFAAGKTTYTTSATKCTVRYNQTGQTVAAGRVWGDFDCGAIENQSQQRICSATGQLRFENCAQ